MGIESQNCTKLTKIDSEDRLIYEDGIFIEFFILIQIQF